MMRSRTEDRLHEALDERGIPHQRNVRIGRYEVDFVLGESLIIEVDGYHHLSRSRRRHDAVKSSYLHAAGYSVHRVPASEVWIGDRLQSFIDEVQAHLERPREKDGVRSLTKGQLHKLRTLRRVLARAEGDDADAAEKERARTPREIMLEHLDAHFPPRATTEE